MKVTRVTKLSVLIFCASLTACASQQEANSSSSSELSNSPELINSSELKQVAVATAHPLATKAGLDILQKGGNAFDAAVAISAALAVVEPRGSGFGGGGFWLLHRESDEHNIFVDGREKAPLAAHRDMYLDEQGTVIELASKVGPLAAGIPGLPAGLVHINKHYGQLPLEETLQPAYDYAINGFAVTPELQQFLQFSHTKFNSAAKQIFPKASPELGEVIIQNDLAATIQKLARHGKRGFYQGDVAKAMVDDVRRHGGIWTMNDLDQYEVIEREPITFNYRGARIVSAPPPSSGGIVLWQALKIIEQLDLQVDLHSDQHLVVEALKLAYRDRALHLGDADFYPIDIEALTNVDYLRKLAGLFSEDRVIASESLYDKETTAGKNKHKGEDTTHFSVIDAQGNRVAATLSINFPFGSGFIPKGTGVFLNNEMDDFAVKANTPNGYGLVGWQANEIVPEKRPLSSMSPTFIEQKDEQTDQVTVLGSPGGSKIISMVLLGILRVVDEGLPLQKIVTRPRFHHQFLPDTIQYEQGAFSLKEQSYLKSKGHEMSAMGRNYGNMQAVQRRTKTKGGVHSLSAASDPRGEGAAKVVEIK